MRPKPSELLKKARIPALLISSPVNIRYLTGVVSDDALLLVRGSTLTLFVGDLEFEAVKAECPRSVRLKHWKGYEVMLRGIRVCGFEADDFKVGDWMRLRKKLPKIRLKPIDDPLGSFRRTKDADALKAILRANRITEDILARIPSILKKGMTETGVAWIIESWARQQGAEKMGFETIVGFGPHTSRPHHRPTARKLKKGDLVQIDMGVVVDGYTSDRSAVYFTGKPTAQQKMVLKALEEAKEAGINAVAPGVPCSEPDRAARSVLKKYKLATYFVHSTGHGVGLEIHEGVILSKHAKETLREHEVVTIEPGVYFPGKWGMRLEDMVVVQ